MKKSTLTLLMFCLTLVPRGWGQPAAPSVQWQGSYGGSAAEILHAIKQTSDGGYVLAGRSLSPPGGTKTQPNYGNYDFWLVRVDAGGTPLWDRTFGGDKFDALRQVSVTSDGGFVLGGWSESGPVGNKTAVSRGPRDFWVVRTDGNGNKLWEQTYGGSMGETLYRMRETPDGGYVLAGSSSSSPSGNKTSGNFGWNSRDFWLVRIDADGNMLWDRTFGTFGDDDLYTVEVTADGGFILGGSSPHGASGNKTSENFGGNDYWAIRLDSSGNKIWDRSFGGWGTDDLYAAVPLPDGGFMLAGYSASPRSGNKTSVGFGGIDVWVIRLDAGGNMIWDKSFGGAGNDSIMDTLSMETTFDGGLVIATGTGNSTGGNKSAASWGGSDMWIIKIDLDGNKEWDQSFGASDTDSIYAVEQTADGGFIYGGPSYSDRGGNKTTSALGVVDYWVVKVGPDVPLHNDPPTISAVPDQVLDEDLSTGLLAFTIGDAETAPDSLRLSVRGFNPALLSPGGFQLGGSGVNRTLVVTPLPGQWGSSQVEVVVMDAHGAGATNRFGLTVRAVNDPPSLGPVPDQLLGINGSSAELAVVVGDDETLPTHLTLLVSSSNPGLVPQAGLVTGGVGAGRTLRVVPASNAVGTATITLRVGDGALFTTRTFEVEVREVVVNEADLVAHWRMDEGAGGVLVDELGGNHGVLLNGPAWVTGRMGGALALNGANQNARIPDSDALDLGVRMSIGLWFKPSVALGGGSGRKDLLAKFLSYWLILNHSGNNGRLAFALNNGTPYVTSTTSEWREGEWYHVGVTCDGLVMSLYINGVLENAVASAGPPAAGTFPLEIGGNTQQGIFFPASVDDVRLYDVALSPQEIRDLAESDVPAGPGPVDPPDPGPSTNGVAVAYVTSVRQGTVRNDFTGLVGYRITMGPEPVQVTALGRFAFAGDSEPHLVKIVRADGSDLPGGSVMVSMAGAVADDWKYQSLGSPVILGAGQNYYVVSAERAGGDRFGDVNSTVVTTGVAAGGPGIYAVVAPQYFLVGGGGQAYGPPNFRYTGMGGPVPPAGPAAVFAAPADGTEVTLPAVVTLTVTTSAGVTNVDFYSDGLFLGRDGGEPARFVWSDPPVGVHVLTARATDGSGATGLADAVTLTVRAGLPAATNGVERAFIVGKVPGGVRNDYSGLVGMKITVGVAPLTVTRVGRLIRAGNSRKHLVKFVEAGSRMDVPGGGVTIDTVGGTPGEFKYEPLPAPLVLAARGMYYLVTEETQGGDTWHGVDGSSVTTMDVAMVDSGVYVGGGYGWTLAGAPGRAYGLVDFKLLAGGDGAGAGGGSGGGGVMAASAEGVLEEEEEAAGSLRLRTPGGEVHLEVVGRRGWRQVLEASDDLVGWRPIAEHTMERDEITIADPGADGRRHRFYRLRLLRWAEGWE